MFLLEVSGANDGKTKGEGRLNKPTVPQVLPIVNAYYAIPGIGLGGSCHIVLEDPNWTDEDVDFCIKWAQEKQDREGEHLARILRLMSYTQRKKLAAQHEYPGVEMGAPLDTFWFAVHKAGLISIGQEDIEMPKTK